MKIKNFYMVIAISKSYLLPDPQHMKRSSANNHWRCSRDIIAVFGTVHKLVTFVGHSDEVDTHALSYCVVVRCCTAMTGGVGDDHSGVGVGGVDGQGVSILTPAAGKDGALTIHGHEPICAPGYTN